MAHQRAASKIQDAGGWDSTLDARPGFACPSSRPGTGGALDQVGSITSNRGFDRARFRQEGRLRAGKGVSWP
jgi:hypothetical protein